MSSEDNKICYKVAILKDGTERLYNRTEWNKKYYEKNKERLTNKIVCECGGKYSTINKSSHMKTKRHKKFLSNNN